MLSASYDDGFRKAERRVRDRHWRHAAKLRPLDHVRHKLLRARIADASPLLRGPARTLCVVFPGAASFALDCRIVRDELRTFGDRTFSVRLDGLENDHPPIAIQIGFRKVRVGACVGPSNRIRACTPLPLGRRRRRDRSLEGGCEFIKQRNRTPPLLTCGIRFELHRKR